MYRVYFTDNNGIRGEQEVECSFSEIKLEVKKLESCGFIVDEFVLIDCE